MSAQLPPGFRLIVNDLKAGGAYVSAAILEDYIADLDSQAEAENTST